MQSHRNKAKKRPYEEIGTIEEETYSDSTKKPRLASEENSEENDVAAICAATVRFTKSLLGLGAENNWQDVVNSKGTSWIAGDYRRFCLYASKRDRRLSPQVVSSKKSGNITPLEGIQPARFFYFNPSVESPDFEGNHIVHKAVCAVLANSGSCDEHAYVVATLLRQFLPKGTRINICAFKDNDQDSDFAHTFVVIGNVKKEVPNPDKETINNFKANDNLLVVDAWPIIGGATQLGKFWLRKDTYKNLSYIRHTLKVDYTFLADGKDRLFKKVLKQQALAKHAAEQTQGFSFVQSDPGMLHHEFKDQHGLLSRIAILSRAQIEEYRNDVGMWNATALAEPYVDPENTKEIMFELLRTHPLLKKILGNIDEALEEKRIPERLGSGFSL